MVQSLQIVTATPNAPVSSVTTTAPSVWQVTFCGMLLDLAYHLPRSRKPLSSLPAPVSSQLCRGKWCVLCYRLGQLMYSGTKTGNVPMTAGCPTLWSQPESTAPNGKNTVNALMNSLLASLQAFISGTRSLVFQ